MKSNILFYGFVVFMFMAFSTLNLLKITMAEEAKPDELLHPELYPNSPFNEKIPPDPEIDKDSDKMVENLVKTQKEKGFNLTVKEFSVPIYYADENTPKHKVALTAIWAPAETMKDVPIPSFAEPDPGFDDRSMVVIDLSTGCEYDFWRARKDDDGKWAAAWGNALSINGDGIFPKGLSAMGSGFALTNSGIIWPDELQNGVINHALGILVNPESVKGPGYVPPATESDGESSIEGAIPEGARIQLDPSLNLDDFNLEPYEKTIAKAMQEYGMILVDRTSAELSIRAVNPISVNINPYEGILPDEKWVELPNIPVEHFRVLKLPELIDAEPELVLNECTKDKFTGVKDGGGGDDNGDDEDDGDDCAASAILMDDIVNSEGHGALQGQSIKNNDGLVKAWSNELKVLRQFRDNVLAKDITGLGLISLYYRHSGEITKIMGADPELKARAKYLLKEIIAVVRDLKPDPSVDDAAKRMPGWLMADIASLLAEIWGKGDIELRDAVNKLRAMFFEQ